MLYPAPESPQGLFLRTGSDTAALRPGQTYAGRILDVDGTLHLQVARQRLPLADPSGLTAGQAVRVAVVREEGGLRLTVTPGAANGPAEAPANQLGGLIANLAKAFNLRGNPEQLQALLPGSLPPTPAAVQAFLRALLLPTARTEDLAQLTVLLQQAVQGGALPQEVFNQFQSGVAAYAFNNEGDLRRQLDKGATRPEARLAQALRNGTLKETVAALRQELRSLVATLRGNEALRTWLTGQRLLKRFEESTKNLTEQWSNEDLPALRSLDQKPYGYLDLSMGADAAFLRLQLHWLGQEVKPAAGERDAGTTVAIDLDTTQLGPLWILLHKDAAHCHCMLRVERDSTRDILDRSQQELADALQAAGYSPVNVKVTAWHGDRVAALHEFFGPAGGLDVTG